METSALAPVYPAQSRRVAARPVALFAIYQEANDSYRTILIRCTDAYGTDHARHTQIKDVDTDDPNMNLIQTTLTCPGCKTNRYIWRKRNRRHGRGHIKDLYCEVCKEVTKQVDHNADYARRIEA